MGTWSLLRLVVREGLSEAFELNPGRGEKAEHVKIWRNTQAEGRERTSH